MQLKQLYDVDTKVSSRKKLLLLLVISLTDNGPVRLPKWQQPDERDHVPDKVWQVILLVTFSF